MECDWSSDVCSSDLSSSHPRRFFYEENVVLLLRMVDKFNTRERELYVDLLDRHEEKKSLADLKLLQALAVEMALYEEATNHLQVRKTITQGVKHEIPSAWIGIRNSALKNIQNITKQLGISEMAKSEKPETKVTKLELFKNGKKDILQKAAGG
jgi:phage terminase small subunit